MIVIVIFAKHAVGKQMNVVAVLETRQKNCYQLRLLLGLTGEYWCWSHTGVYQNLAHACSHKWGL
jgi:hypothetical protein